MNSLNRRKILLGAAAGAGLLLPGHPAFADIDPVARGLSAKALGQTKVNPKTLVYFGSSNMAGVGASTYTADPSASNNYASPSSSWAGLLATQIKSVDSAWTFYNRSKSGEGTAAAIARFWTDVAPYRPSHVFLGHNPVNDSLDPQAFVRNTIELCRLCDSIGAVPILRGASPYNSYTAAQYQAMLSLNRDLDRLGRWRVDHMSTLDNGSGTYVGGATYTADGLHPTDAGHAILYTAIDIGMIMRGGARPLLIKPDAGAWAVQTSATTGNGILIRPSEGLQAVPRSFTMRARVKGASGVAASKAFLCAYYQGDGLAPFRMRNAAGTYDIADNNSALGSASTVNPTSDFTTHDLVITYNQATNVSTGYVDGASFASATPAGTTQTIATFSFGSRAESASGTSAAGYSFADLGIWQAALSAADIADMFRTGRKPRASMIFDGDLSYSPPSIGSEGLIVNAIANGLLPVIGEAAWQSVPPF